MRQNKGGKSMEHINVNVIPLEGITKRVSITKGVVDEKTRSLLD